MNTITRYLDSITMYRLMLYFLIVLLGTAVVLSALRILPYNAAGILLQTVAFVGICWAVNMLIASALKIQPNIESSLITGLILAAIAGPLSLPREWLPLVVMALAAMTSKYLIVLEKSHIFNPAAFGVIVSAAVLGQPASWWIGSLPLLPVLLIGGLLMMQKIRRFHLVFSFLGVYLGLLAVNALLLQGRSLPVVATLITNLLSASPLLFFSFVMLTEPLTAPQTVRRRTAFGALVGAAFFVLPRAASFIPYSLELSLLIGNAFTRLTNPDFRQAFSLRSKELFSSSIASFWFEPTRPFSFAPGQFLEYTFAHPRPDARGIRRYFSIASSPTEKQVLLTARFAKKSSSFKRSLRTMEAGDEIIASKVAGDFVLPGDPAQKLAFIAGGIGITPFRSMVKFLTDTGDQRDIVLLYAAREEGDLVFRDVFEEARRKFNMRTIYVVSDTQQVPSSEHVRGGMIDETAIRREIPDFHERLFYVSGPEGMVQAIAKVLGSMNVPRKHIKRDFFPGYSE